MSRTPVTVIIQASAHQGEWYRCRVVGWGVDDGGSYGSLWSRDLPVQITRRATAREVLRQVGMALLDLTGAAVPHDTEDQA